MGSDSLEINVSGSYCRTCCDICGNLISGENGKAKNKRDQNSIRLCRTCWGKKQNDEGKCFYCADFREPGVRYCRKHYFRTTSRSAIRRTASESDIDEFAYFIAVLWHQQECRSALSGRSMPMCSASLDRIVPGANGGKYEAGNVRWVLKSENTMKWDSTDEEFFSNIRAILEYNNKK